MKASFFERVSAYAVDLVIVGVVCFAVIIVMPKQDTSVLKNEIKQIRGQYAAGEISFSEYSKAVADPYYQVDGVSIPQTMVTIIITMCYFMYYQFKNKGQTLGKKLMKIRVVKEKEELSLNDMIYRSLLVDGVIFSMLAVAIIFITNRDAYFASKLIINGIQIAVMFGIGIMVIYRKDKRGLHDILTKTNVVSER